jgi:glycosyltransferase involved in cell wall biosynthesis
MMLYKLISTLDRDRFSGSVVTLTPGGAVADRIRERGIPVHSLGMRRGRPSPQSIAALVRLLRRERPHVLQTWMYHANLLGLLAGRLAGVPHVVWNVRCSDFIGRDHSRLTRWTNGACAALSRWPSAVVINTRVGLEVHRQMGYRPRRWNIIPNGFDVQQFKPDADARVTVRREFGLDDDVPLVGLFARLDPMKDHATFFRAAAQVVAVHPRTRFVLAGSGVLPDSPFIRELSWSEHLESAVHPLGERADVSRLLAAMDVLVSSSAYGEGFSNVIGEAMACGVPCVVTNVGDSASIVGNTGIVVPPRDPAALARGMISLLELPAHERHARGAAARERVERHFSLPAIVGQYEALYAALGAP